jgi:hypothetical protein
MERWFTMTLHDYFLIALVVVTFVIFPIWGAVQAWRYLQLSPKERRQRRDARKSWRCGRRQRIWGVR